MFEIGLRQHYSSSRSHTVPSKAWTCESATSHAEVAERLCVRSSPQHHHRPGAPAAPSKGTQELSKGTHCPSAGRRSDSGLWYLQCGVSAMISPSSVVVMLLAERQVQHLCCGRVNVDTMTHEKEGRRQIAASTAMYGSSNSNTNMQRYKPTRELKIQEVHDTH